MDAGCPVLGRISREVARISRKLGRPKSLRTKGLVYNVWPLDVSAPDLIEALCICVQGALSDIGTRTMASNFKLEWDPSGLA